MRSSQGRKKNIIFGHFSLDTGSIICDNIYSKIEVTLGEQVMITEKTYWRIVGLAFWVFVAIC